MIGQLNPNVNFHGNVTSIEKDENTDVKSKLVSSPEKDEFQKEDSEVITEPPKKKNIAKKIALGTVSAILLIYGSVVLKRKLSKPSFEEIQKCFKEIFEKDLSADEVKALVKKYKEICKNDNTEDFTKQLIEQLKKDYGIEKVATNVNVTKLKDAKLKTALEQTEYGNANPLGEINIMPRTSRDELIRSIQEDTFVTGFHEVKHIKQFSEAYRTNPDKLAEAILKIHPCMRSDEELLKAYNEGQINQAKKLIQTIPELKSMTVEELCRLAKQRLGFKSDKDIIDFIKRNQISSVRQLLDQRFGHLKPFKPGSARYKKGLEYINSYANYPNSTKNYEAYRNNLLEKEAWHIGDLARKIYKYTSSIWKL